MAKIRYFLIYILFFNISCNNSLHTDDIKSESKSTSEIVVKDSITKKVDTLIIVKDTIAEIIKEDKIIPVIKIDTVQKIQEVPEIKKLTLQEIYNSQVGVREKTGKNDGPEVEMYLKSVGLGKGYAWCAAFVHWSLDSAGYNNPITAWSPTAHNKNNIIYFQGAQRKKPIPGDVFTLYYPKLKRIGHTGFYDKTINSSIYESVEGNTNGEGSREGDGVYRKKRSFKATYSITRWTE